MGADMEKYRPPLPEGLSRVEEIIELERFGDRCQEEAARRIAAELAEGKSLRKLAGEIGRSHEHVRRMAKAWELRCHPRVTPSDQRTFNEVYHSQEVRGTGRKVVQGSAEPAALPPPETGEPPIVAAVPDVEPAQVEAPAAASDPARMPPAVPERPASQTEDEQLAELTAERDKLREDCEAWQERWDTAVAAWEKEREQFKDQAHGMAGELAEKDQEVAGLKARLVEAVNLGKAARTRAAELEAASQAGPERGQELEARRDEQVEALEDKIRKLEADLAAAAPAVAAYDGLDRLLDGAS